MENFSNESCFEAEVYISRQYINILTGIQCCLLKLTPLKKVNQKAQPKTLFKRCLDYSKNVSTNRRSVYFKSKLRNIFSFYT